MASQGVCHPPALNHDVLGIVFSFASLKTLLQMAMASKEDGKMVRPVIIQRLNDSINVYFDKDGTITGFQFKYNDRVYTVESPVDGVTRAVPDGVQAPVNDDNFVHVVMFVSNTLGKYKKMLESAMESCDASELKLWHEYLRDLHGFFHTFDRASDVLNVAEGGRSRKPLSKMTVKELREKAKVKKIRHYSSLDKAGLVAALQSGRKRCVG